MFGSQETLKKEKNTKKNDFFTLGCPIENTKEYQIYNKPMTYT